MPDIFDRLVGQAGEDQIDESHSDALNMDAPDLDTHGESDGNSEAAQSAEQYTGRKIKDAVQELLKYGLVEMERKPNLYQVLLSHRQPVADILEPLDLLMQVDDIRGLAFLKVAEMAIDDANPEQDEWSHPLVRRQRLNLEQSLLVALLRQHFIAHEVEAGVGAGNATVALEDLLPQLQLYLGGLGSDAREHNRLRGLLEKLKGHGIVSEIDKHEQITIRPIIAHVANPENLLSLLQVFRQQAAGEGAGQGQSDERMDEDAEEGTDDE
jgi:hypothetical protein